MPKSKHARLGWIPDRPDFRDKLYRAIAKPPAAMPPKVDLRATCSAVEDQGDLGSCTANALVGNLEFLCRKHTQRTPPNYSRLFVYYNERVIEGTVGEDSGAMLRDGVKSLVKKGACLESAWPYFVQRFARKPPSVAYTAAQRHRVTSYHRIVSLLEMRQCLAEGYPFVFGFSVYDSFVSAAVAKSGIVPMPDRLETQLGGHAVMAVGYDDVARTLLVRNSWGTSWGMRGYFTMPYDYVASTELADDFWTLRAFEGG